MCVRSHLSSVSAEIHYSQAFAWGCNYSIPMGPLWLCGFVKVIFQQV